MLRIGLLYLLLLPICVLASESRYHADLVSETLHNVSYLPSMLGYRFQLLLRGPGEVHDDRHTSKQRQLLLQHLHLAHSAVLFVRSLDGLLLAVVPIELVHALVALLLDRRYYVVGLVLAIVG